MSSTFNLKVGAAVGALILAAILVPTFERPPVQSEQGGFRGTSMGTVVNPRLRAVRSDQPVPFVAADPSRHAGERAELERRYNGGNAIAGALGPADLSARDVLYVGDSLAVVVRVNGLELERYFLVGQVDLGRGELRRDGINRYRVLSDFRR